MNLSELRRESVTGLMKIAAERGIEARGGTSKQELIFSLLEAATRENGEIQGDGVLEKLPDGYGFLRSPASNYMPGPDDIYVSPSQIRRFKLQTGDTVSGQIRPPKEGERYFALLRVHEINYEPPDASKNKIRFDSLTPLYPEDPFNLEGTSGRLAPACSAAGVN